MNEHDQHSRRDVTTAGYDVGGAHLKVALASDGKLLQVVQIPCPLWRGLDQLDKALVAARAITSAADVHAFTMTGELADVFPDRYTGVARLIEIVTAALGPHTKVWMGQHGLGTLESALENYPAVASTNFLATAELAAGIIANGLLIDMGSTTTDIVPFAQGAVTARGLTDADRLRTGELVYTGLTRTPVMAVTTRGLFQGQWQGLARDPFATMADVRRVLATLPGDVDQHGTADGRGTSIAESRARLARCFGRDVAPGEDHDWQRAAAAIAQTQLASIVEGAEQVLAAVPLPSDAMIITAGIGAEVAAQVSALLGRRSITFGTLIEASPQLRDWATRCAPAVALALLD